MITTWTDRMINPGDDWKTAINDNLNNSGIILLLISSSFMASEYCYGIEMKTALERDEKDEAIAIPVILRDCLWQIGPFAKLQALPKDGKPIQKFTRKDDAYTSIAREICRIIQGN
jgi:TIR domain